jgi:hypothetical protein
MFFNCNRHVGIVEGRRVQMPYRPQSSFSLKNHFLGTFSGTRQNSVKLSYGHVARVICLKSYNVEGYIGKEGGH